MTSSATSILPLRVGVRTGKQQERCRCLRLRNGNTSSNFRPGGKAEAAWPRSCSPILSLQVRAPETARPPGDRGPAQRYPGCSPAEAGEGGDPGLVGRRRGWVPRLRPRRAEDGCPGARRTVTCHTGRAAPGPPPPPLPSSDLTPAGSATRAIYVTAARAGGAQRAGYPGRLLSLLRDPGPCTGFRCASRRKSADDPHPVGPLGMRSAPALVRRSPGFRRSSERRQEVGPGRSRWPGVRRLLGALRCLLAAWRCVIYEAGRPLVFGADGSDETSYLGPCRRGGKRSPLQFPLLETERKRTYPPPSPILLSTSHGSLSCGTPLGPRSSVHGPRPPAAGNTRRNGPASRGKQTRLRRGLGMLGSRRLQVGSLLASSAAAGVAAAGCRLDRSGEGRCGRAALPGSLALGRESAIGAEPARLPAPDFVPQRGARRVEKNSGSCDDSRASESRGGGGGPASRSRAAGSDPSLAGPA
ncbi:hypothetical protein LEMLEM_LOCUS3497 [Lemmus lemmus]